MSGDQKIWHKRYPEGIPHEINPEEYQSVTQLFDNACKRFQDRAAFRNMGASISYSELYQLSADFASFLQNEAGLKKGDKVAIQMPNVLQYPVVLFGAMRAGLTVVNTNPLYTSEEMRHQFKDSGAKALVLLETSGANLEKILKDTDIETVVVSGVGDMLGFPKSWIVNFAVRHIKKMVPKYSLASAYSWYEALDIGSEKAFTPVETGHDDLAFLQYTGGTTGVAKGAMLTHRNIISNMLQVREWIKSLIQEGEEVAILALPMYHIFSLTVNGLCMLDFGATNLMITNPRDIPGFVKTLQKEHYTVVAGVNTLFNALMNNSDFQALDFSQLKISVAGGMALQKNVALRWKDMTKSVIVEGYGLTETSPVATVNPVDGTDVVGTIGLPLPSTDIRLIDDNEKEVALGERGEIAIKGPQVMKGYWQRPEDTANVMTSDGYFKSGDIGIMNEEGFTQIVDRKKDMILVSGFNVYPNEIEDVIANLDAVSEVAAIGVPDEKSTEAVKVFIVTNDSSLTKEQVIAHCRESLTSYKIPRHVEFREELPKTNVGKILRRALRDEELAKA
ncbi:MAG: AMP-binding protein [Bdellovibrionales bacterium]|nr:AMP-binding protein [Bdellovibrionales bacterium]